MRKVKRWRYYCEYCKKAGGSAYHMDMHERGCTNNPQRVCGMCGRAGLKQASMEELVIALGNGSEEGMERLRELCGNCPACILAAVRQSGLMAYDTDPEGTGYTSTDLGMNNYTMFDFLREKKEFWASVKDEADHQREVEETYYGMCGGGGTF